MAPLIYALQALPWNTLVRWGHCRPVYIASLNPRASREHTWACLIKDCKLNVLA